MFCWVASARVAVARALVLGPVPRAAPRRGGPRRGEPLSIETLEAMEAELLAGGKAPPPLGRECAAYRWTQDGETVEVEVPLPFAPPRSDVSLVVGDATFALAVINSGLEVSGDLGVAAVAPASRWDLRVGGDGAASVVVTVRKAVAEAENGCGIFWREFLRGEAAAPTVAYRGVDAASGAAFEQTAAGFDLEVALPDGVAACDVAVDVADDAFRASARGATVAAGAFVGSVDAAETVWFVDGRTVHVALTKRHPPGPWPGLCAEPRDAYDDDDDNDP